MMNTIDLHRGRQLLFPHLKAASKVTMKPQEMALKIPEEVRLVHNKLSL